MKRASVIFMASALMLGGTGQGSATAGQVLLAANANGTIDQITSSGQVSLFATNSGGSDHALVFDALGNVYTASNGNNIVAKYSPTGANIGPFISSGLAFPAGLAFDSSGNLFVADEANWTVKKFSPSGALLGTVLTVSNANRLVFDPAGNLYVSRFASNGGVEEYTASGTFIRDAATAVNGAASMAFDGSGNLYVSAFLANTVEVFSPSGVHLLDITSPALNLPDGLAFDAIGNLYVANTGNGIIEKFSPSGNDLGAFASGLNSPQGIQFEPGGTAAPEPATVTLLGIGMAGMAGYGWRRRKQAVAV